MILLMREAAASLHHVIRFSRDKMKQNQEAVDSDLYIPIYLSSLVTLKVVFRSSKTYLGLFWPLLQCDLLQVNGFHWLRLCSYIYMGF